VGVDTANDTAVGCWFVGGQDASPRRPSGADRSCGDRMRPAGAHGEDEIALRTAAASADRTHHFDPSSLKRQRAVPPCGNRGDNPEARHASTQPPGALDRGD
jgi:hypothetical protein